MIFTSEVEAKTYNKAQCLITDIKNESAFKSAKKWNTPFIGILPDSTKIVVPTKHVLENNLIGIKLNSNIFNAPIPEETESYFPIGNTNIATSVIDKVYNEGFEIEEVGFQNNAKYSQFFGWMRIGDKYNDPAYRPAIAFRNSYDKSSRFAMAIGLNVNLCSNLSFSKHTVMTKHTSNQGADFENYISQIVSKIQPRYEEEISRLEILKDYSIDKKTTYELIGMFLYEQEVINVTQCNALVKEIKEQRLWKNENYFDFYMHVTEVLKTTAAIQSMESYNKAYNTLVDYAHIPVLSN